MIYVNAPTEVVAELCKRMPWQVIVPESNGEPPPETVQVMAQVRSTEALDDIDQSIIRLVLAKHYPEIENCVMAGMARSGEVYPLELPDELLQRAFQNTVELLKSNVEVVKE